MNCCNNYKPVEDTIHGCVVCTSCGVVSEEGGFGTNLFLDAIDADHARTAPMLRPKPIRGLKASKWNLEALKFRDKLSMTMDQICETNEIKGVKQLAIEFYDKTKVSSGGMWRGKRIHTVACVYLFLGGRAAGMPISIQRAIAISGQDAKKFHGVLRFVKEHLGEKVLDTNPALLVPRAMNSLGIEDNRIRFTITKRAQAFVRSNAHQSFANHTLVAGSILMACKDHGIQIPPKDAERMLHVKRATLVNCMSVLTRPLM